METTMRRHVIEFHDVNRPLFEAIRTGTKRVETRAATEKYTAVRAGDEVLFVCGGETCLKTVVTAKRFRTVDELLGVYPPSAIAPWLSSVEDVRALYQTFPGYAAKLERHGVVAFELQ